MTLVLLQSDAMTQIIETIQQRRSLRRYEQKPIPTDVLEQLLSAAIWAPSAHNRQPWRFAVLQSDEAKVQLARNMGERLRQDLSRDHAPQTVIEQDVARSYERLTLAPVLIVLALSMADMDTYPDARRQQFEHTMAVQSTAMAGQNLLLAAHSLGLGACWMCAPLFCQDVVQQTLALPADWQAQAIITLGYPSQTRERTRHPLEKSVLWY